MSHPTHCRKAPHILILAAAKKVVAAFRIATTAQIWPGEPYSRRCSSTICGARSLMAGSEFFGTAASFLTGKDAASNLRGSTPALKVDPVECRLWFLTAGAWAPCSAGTVEGINGVQIWPGTTLLTRKPFPQQLGQAGGRVGDRRLDQTKVGPDVESESVGPLVVADLTQALTGHLESGIAHQHAVPAELAGALWASLRQ